MIARRRLIGAAAGSLVISRRSRASGTLRLVVGSAPGFGADLEARAFVPFLERHLPHASIEVINQPGESGLAAYRLLAAAGADQMMVGWLATPALPARVVDHNAGDLAGRLVLLGAMQKEAIALVSPASSPLGSAQEMFKLAATDAASVPVGTPPAGSAPHLAMLRLQELAATRLNIVVFPSAAAARQAVVSGNVAAAALALGEAIGPLRDGRLSGLGIAARTRADAFPAMPPLRDAGLNLAAFILRGLAAPAGLDDEVRHRLVDVMLAVVRDPEYQAQAEAGGFVGQWLDGPGWQREVEAERVDLARLWAADPWLPISAG